VSTSDPPDPPAPPDPRPPDAPERASAPGEPDWANVPAERPLPRGCHPLVFGVVMGTIQFAVTLYLWRC
jgi:hypothetical protein